MKMMKKLVALTAVVILAFGLAACGKSVTKDALVVSKNLGAFEIKINYDAEGDKVVKMTQVGTIDMSKLPDDQKSLIKSSVDEAKKSYEKFDFVKYDTKESDGKLVETIEIDLSNKDNVAKLADGKLLDITGSKGGFISLEKTKDNFKSQGFKVEKYEEAK